MTTVVTAVDKIGATIEVVLNRLKVPITLKSE